MQLREAPSALACDVHGIVARSEDARLDLQGVPGLPGETTVERGRPSISGLRITRVLVVLHRRPWQGPRGGPWASTAVQPGLPEALPRQGRRPRSSATAQPGLWTSLRCSLLECCSWMAIPRTPAPLVVGQLGQLADAVDLQAFGGGGDEVEHLRFTGGRPGRVRQRTHRGRHAGTVGPQETEERSARHLEGEPLE